MDTKTVGLIGNIVKIVLALGGAVLCFLIISNSSSIEAGTNQGYVDGALNISYIAMALCVGIAVLFGLFYFIKNIGKSKGMLFAIVGLAIVGFIAYSMSDGVAAPELVNKYGEDTIKLSGAGIYITIILLALGVVVALLSEVAKIFK